MLVFSLLILLAATLCNAQCFFVWKPSVSMLSAESYVDKKLPCQNDDVVIESNWTNVVYLNGPLKVNSLVLPSNGELIFGSNVDFGKKADWQCEGGQRQTRKIEDQPAFDFYGPENWLIYDYDYNNHLLNKPRLDAMRVPGDQDKVYFPANSTSKIGMQFPALVRDLRFGSKSVSSDDIYRFLLTQEGRLRIKLGGSLATTVEIGHKAFMWPIGQVFSVRRQARPKYGRPLSNIIQPQFSGICFHVNCPNATDYCLNPVTLIGNCCPACVAVATFRATNVPNFWFVQKGLQQLDSMYPSYLGISKIRMDTDALHPAYQLAIIPDKPENYDEDYFRKALDTALYTATNWYTAGNVQMFDIKIHVCTQKNRLSIGYIFKCILVALASLLFAIGLFVYEYKRNATLRFWITKLANRWRLNTEDLVFFSRGAVHLWREEEGQEEPASFENVIFKEGSSSKNKPSTKADEQSTSNEADYLSLNETETLV